ncbi:MAG TPA: hypothetical protein VMY77_12745 [Chitinophagaceae bacterium]|nr:hypothetical protein [Chitinophagaceae bacterium]
MAKRFLIAALILFFLIIAGYLFIRYRYLKVKSFTPDNSKAKNAIDLRPSIIAKLQQLVKDGSNGLYILSVEKIEPHLLSSKLDAFNASIRIDTAAMQHLDSLELLPDDIFTFTFPKLHIDGIGIDDLLHKDRLELTGIIVLDPLINVYNKKRWYNKDDHRDTLSLYEKLKGQMRKIAIGKIEVMNGTVINHTEKSTTKYNGVSVLVNEVLIDSTTQFDRSRFLFAKHARFSTKNYSIPTKDGLYFFSAANIIISGDQHTITAQNVELRPRYNRRQFEDKLKFGKDMYQLLLPKVTLRDVDWPALINSDRFILNEAITEGGTFKIFYDRAKPQAPIKLDNFPHQVLMTVPFPLSVKKWSVKNLDISYEEHNPLTDKNGTAYFDNATAEITNVTNIPSEIKRDPFSTISANALFMHKTPLQVKFKYDLSKYRTGEFTADITMNSIDSTSINTIAAPLGLFTIKTGIMQKAVIHVQGNNLRTHGKITMLYSDLHITPLKKDEDGDLKKKRVTSLLANVILIKNENPKDNELRQPDFTVERGTHKNFFNLLWTSVLTGIVKTVGIPTKMVRK